MSASNQHLPVFGGPEKRAYVRTMDVVEAIVSVPTDSLDAPLTPIPLKVSVIQMTAAQIEATGFKLK